ncbi:MAG: DUF4129 domain-containing protein [Acidimicrobiales bacterium]
MIAAPPDPPSVRHLAHEIVSRPEFRQAPPSPIDRLRRWVFGRIAHVVQAALSGRMTVVGITLLVGIALLVAYLGYRVVRGVSTDRRATADLPGGTARPPSDWLREATDCEARGDWRGALLARYRALLAELALRHLIDEVPGRTTGEYRLAVSGALPAATESFSGATELFDSTMYGARETGPGEATRLAELSRRVLSSGAP